MKTKSFLLFSTSVFAVSIFLIVCHSQPPQSIQNIVSQTHQQIKDFQLPQEKLRDVEENNLVQEERYERLVGLGGHVDPWRNTTVPVLVTYGRTDGHALLVSFVHAAARFPYTILVYNLDLQPYSLAVVTSYCNSSKCAVIDFDLNSFPSHVSDESIYAFRPLIIQHALSRVGGVIFCEPSQRWTGSSAGLGVLWRRAASSPMGVVAWPRRAAVTSLTHPRMFHYLHADIEDFLFVQMVNMSRLFVANSSGVADVMTPWIQCALTLDCIMPIGAQSVGCKFDKKPQYRYSGCHGQDASALSIVLGLRSGFEEAQYTERGHNHWQRERVDTAREYLRGLRRNDTESETRAERPERTDRAEQAEHTERTERTPA